MADELAPSRSPNELESDLEKARVSSARLLESLARKIGGGRVVRTATEGIDRAAQYVQAYSVKDMATGIDRVVRRRPVASILVAVAAGFVIARALRPR